MTSFYENQESGTNGLGVSDRFPWQGPVGPSGSAQVPNLNAFSQQENATNVFQQQLTPPSALADVNGIQQAMQKFQMQPKTVMAGDMADTEFKFRNLAAKYAAQDNSKPQQSSTGEDNGVSYKTRDEDHATGPDAWASLGKFMKTGGDERDPDYWYADTAQTAANEMEKEERKNWHNELTRSQRWALQEHATRQGNAMLFGPAGWLAGKLIPKERVRQPLIDAEREQGLLRRKGFWRNFLNLKPEDITEKKAYGGSDETGEWDRFLDMGVPYVMAQSPKRMAAFTQAFADSAKQQGAELGFDSQRYGEGAMTPEQAIEALSNYKGNLTEAEDDSLPYYYTMNYPLQARKGLLQRLRLRNPDVVEGWPGSHPYEAALKILTDKERKAHEDDVGISVDYDPLVESDEKPSELKEACDKAELTPYQYGFAVRVHEANLSPQQIRDGIEKVAEHMGEEYAEELREGMEKIAVLGAAGAAVKPMLQGAWSAGKGYLQKKLPQWLGGGVAQKVAPQATQQLAKQVAPQATQQVAKQVAPKMKDVGTSLADIPKSLATNKANKVVPNVTQKFAPREYWTSPTGYARNVESLASRGLKPGPHAPGGGVPKPMWQGARAGRHHTETTVDDLIRNAAQQAKAPVSGAQRAGQQFRRALDVTKAAPGQAWNATGGRLPWATGGRTLFGAGTGAGLAGDDATISQRLQAATVGGITGANLNKLPARLQHMARGSFLGTTAGAGFDRLNEMRGQDTDWTRTLGTFGGLGAPGVRSLTKRFTSQLPPLLSKAVPAVSAVALNASDFPDVVANAIDVGKNWNPETTTPTQAGTLPPETTTPTQVDTLPPGEAPVSPDNVAPGTPTTPTTQQSMVDPNPSYAEAEEAQFGDQLDPSGAAGPPVPSTVPGAAGPPVPSTVPPTGKPEAQSGGFMDMLSALGNDKRVAAFGNTINPILNLIGDKTGQGPDFADSINPLMKILMMAGGGLGIGGLLGGGKKMGLGGLGMMAIPLIYQMMQGKNPKAPVAGGAGTAAAGTAAGGQAPTDQPVQQITVQEQARQAAAQQAIGNMATNPETKGIVSSFGTTADESGQSGVFDSPEDVSALVKSHALWGKPSAQEVNTLISNLSSGEKASLADQIQIKWDEVGESFGQQTISGPEIPKLIAALREGTSYN